MIRTIQGRDAEVYNESSHTRGPRLRPSRGKARAADCPCRWSPCIFRARYVPYLRWRPGFWFAPARSERALGLCARAQASRPEASEGAEQWAADITVANTDEATHATDAARLPGRDAPKRQPPRPLHPPRRAGQTAPRLGGAPSWTRPRTGRTARRGSGQDRAVARVVGPDVPGAGRPRAAVRVCG